jgi:hypothetical protein
MRLSLEPVRQRTCAGYPGDLLFVVFLIAMFVIIISVPLFSWAQTSEDQSKPATGQPAEGPVQPQPEAKGESSLEEQWGIQVVAVRLTAAGTMVDFRYRIVDAEKATSLVDRKKDPYLLDQASGAKLSVPTSKVGALRATTKPIAGRQYYILFGNTKYTIKAGSRVAVVIGEFKAENLTVQ